MSDEGNGRYRNGDPCPMCRRTNERALEVTAKLNSTLDAVVRGARAMEGIEGQLVAMLPAMLASSEGVKQGQKHLAEKLKDATGSFKTHSDEKQMSALRGFMREFREMSPSARWTLFWIVIAGLALAVVLAWVLIAGGYLPKPKH